MAEEQLSEPACGVGYESEIYSRRFTEKQLALRNATWKVLCDEFFSKYVNLEDTVLDLAAGEGQFITNIRAKRKIAVDINPSVKILRREGIEVYYAPATNFAKELSCSVDLIFMSNFLEHLTEKRLVLEVFEECKRALNPGGRIMILQPNIRYAGPAYWDYIDHHIALTEHSLVEALDITGFKVEKLIPRFLPYTAKSKLGDVAGGNKGATLVSLYLKLPILWKIFGAQTFVIAKI